MENIVIYIMISLVISALIGKLAYNAGYLTAGGSTAAFLIGSCIGILGSPNWLALLLVFAMIGFFVTRIGFSEKLKAGIQEGDHGERGFWNIVGVALPPLLFAIIDFIWQGNGDIVTIAFVASVAVAMADTSASELGVRDSNVWLITTFKRVPPGTDGGVSVRGTVVSLIFATAISIIGFILTIGTVDVRVIIPIICGTIGCFLDSLLGATLETKGIINKYTNNCVTGILGGLLAIPLCLLL